MSGFSFEIRFLVPGIALFQDFSVELPERRMVPSDGGMGVFWGYRPTQPCVLLLRFLHPPGLIHLQATIFLAPAVVALFGDTDPQAGISNRSTLRQHDPRFTRLADDFLQLVLSCDSIPPSWPIPK